MNSMAQHGYPIGTLLRVLYDFTAEDVGEMSVATNDLVTVIPFTGDSLPNDWILVANTDTQKHGFVPLDYVVPMQSAGSGPVTPAAGPSVFPSPYNTTANNTATAGITSLTPTHNAGALSPSGALPESAPSLELGADYAHLFSSHESWFKAAAARRGEAYRGLQAEAQDLSRALAEAESRSAALLSRIVDLDALIGEERGKWGAKGQAGAPMIA